MGNDIEGILYEHRIQHSNDLKDTTAKIIPICLVVDTSGSMKEGKKDGESKMERLNDGINEFVNCLKENNSTRDGAEVAIVIFNEEAYVYQDFTFVNSMSEVEIHFENKVGDTPLGVSLGLELLQNEKENLRENSKRYRQPWIVIFSDGVATVKKHRDEYGELLPDNREPLPVRLKETQNQVKLMESSGKLTTIPILINSSDQSNFSRAKQEMENFRNDKKCIVLGFDGQSTNEYEFSDFFTLLASSVSTDTQKELFDNIGRKNKEDIEQDAFLTLSDDSDELEIDDSQFEELDDQLNNTKTTIIGSPEVTKINHIITISFKADVKSKFIYDINLETVCNLKNNKKFEIIETNNGYEIETQEDLESETLIANYQLTIYSDKSKNKILYSSSESATEVVNEQKVKIVIPASFLDNLIDDEIESPEETQKSNNSSSETQYDYDSEDDLTYEEDEESRADSVHQKIEMYLNDITDWDRI